MLETILRDGHAAARSEVVAGEARLRRAATSSWPRTSSRQDDEVDRLNREVFRLALEIGDDDDTREWAMTMMLVARALERIGDNAVDIGEQVVFVVTGLFREFPTDDAQAAARRPA